MAVEILLRAGLRCPVRVAISGAVAGTVEEVLAEGTPGLALSVEQGLATLFEVPDA